jgi:hypothetical protein
MSKARDLIGVLEILQGLKSYQGMADNGAEVDIEQKDNGMYSAQLKDDEGNISATTATTAKEVWDWMYDHGVRHIRWSDRREGTLIKRGV